MIRFDNDPAADAAYKEILRRSVLSRVIHVEINGTEVASGAIGPHKLDPAHDVHEPWAGIGFGLERLLMLKNGKSNAKKTGKSITYLNGYKLD